MKNKNILVIDTGSSSIRGMLMNQYGRILAAEQYENFMELKNDREAEQDCRSFETLLYLICSNLHQKCRELNIGLSALCFTSQRSSVLPVSKTGIPLGRMIMWYDKRSEALCSSMDQEAVRAVYNTCGSRLTPVLSAPKMLWLKRNRPEQYENAYKLVGIHDYLLFLCTGQFVTDTSLASRTGLLDLKTGQWSEELIRLFELAPEKLCRLLQPGEQAGTITSVFSAKTGLPKGLPVITSGGDQQCSLIGQAITKAGDAGITAGTGAYLSTVSDTPLTDPLMRTNCCVFVLPGKYVVEASTMSAGSVYRWMRDTFYPGETNYDTINAEISMIKPGAEGLIMFPDLAGKGCPQWNPAALGSFVQIGLHHKRPHFSRAVLEGICGEIKECYDTVQLLLPLHDTITTAGGLSRFSEYNQIIADMLDIRVRKCPVEETTALGAFAVAAASVGLYHNIDEALAAYKRHGLEDSDSSVWQPVDQNRTCYKQQEAVRLLLQTASESIPLPRTHHNP